MKSSSCFVLVNFAAAAFASVLPAVSADPAPAAIRAASGGFGEDLDYDPDQPNQLPLFEKILVALDDSHLVASVTDYVMAQPVLVNAVGDAMVWASCQNLLNVTDFWIATEKSGMAQDLVAMGDEDPRIVFGLIQIFKKVSLGPQKRDDIVVFGDELRVMQKREDPQLNEIMRVAKDSGFARSIITHFLTNPDMTDPSADLAFKLLVPDPCGKLADHSGSECEDCCLEDEKSGW